MIDNKLNSLINECNIKKIIFDNKKTVTNLSELHNSINNLIEFINEIYLNDNNSLLKYQS
jgi:hypothetical protein